MEMKINKKLFILLIIGLGIFLPFLINRLIPRHASQILEKNNFVVEEREIKSPDGKKIQKQVKYINKSISLYEYSYDGFKDVKKNILNDYKQYKDNEGFDTKLEDENNYIYVRACSRDLCFYTLGYQNKMLQSIVNVIDKSDADKIYKTLIEEMKLK